MKKKYKIGVSISGLGGGELHMRNVIENNLKSEEAVKLYKIKNLI